MLYCDYYCHRLFSCTITYGDQMLIRIILNNNKNDI